MALNNLKEGKDKVVNSEGINEGQGKGGETRCGAEFFVQGRKGYSDCRDDMANLR